MASPGATEHVSRPIDPSAPFRGVVLCCTSVAPEHRSEVAAKVQDLGGIHKYDLTPDVTHLVVGEYDTPKYRHVARERLDIKAMDIAWVEEVLELWKKDEDIDFLGLEHKYQLKTFETHGAEPGMGNILSQGRGSLLICLTGFGDQRDEIAESIISNGGKYTGDLTRRCTHLIVNAPEGKKFTAAKAWNVRTVTLKWLTESIERGMILEETKFDPMLPPEEQGRGAWNREGRRRQFLGKRSRSEIIPGPEEGTRKLRRTATAKLNTQRDNIWGDILGRSTSREYSFAHDNGPQPPGEQPRREEPPVPQLPVAKPEGIFSQCVFYIHGFNRQKVSVLKDTLTSLDGRIAHSLEEANRDSTLSTTRKQFLLVVPQASQPDTHPTIPSDGIHTVTEFYIEKCLHNRRYFPPSEHTLGRPFPKFPIPGFADLTVCSATFTGIELSQVARAVTQLGGKFEEQFRQATTVLVCRSLENIRKEKLRLAIRWGVPVVSADWLWKCITTGQLVPFAEFAFSSLEGGNRGQTQPGLGANPPPADKPENRLAQRSRSEPMAKSAAAPRSKRSIAAEESVTSVDFVTAPTGPVPEEEEEEENTPLTELSSASLNKSPSPTKRTNNNIARSKSAPSNAHAASTEDSTPRPPSRRAESERRQDEESVEGGREDSEARKRAAAKALEREDLTSKITSLLDNTAAAQDAPQEPGPRPRRRQIFGRAISNASSAAENNSNPAAAATATTTAPPSAGTDDVESQGGEPPPGTQIGYYDPEAQERRAELLSRMMGGGGDDGAVETVKTSSTGPKSKASAVGGGGGRKLRKR